MVYRVDGWEGIAFYRARRSKDGRAFMVMVGDDRVREVPADTVHRIRDEDYCAECGQIGCSHGRDR